MIYQIEKSVSENRCIVWEVNRKWVFWGVKTVVFKRDGEGCRQKCEAFKIKMTTGASHAR